MVRWDKPIDSEVIVIWLIGPFIYRIPIGYQPVIGSLLPVGILGLPELYTMKQQMSRALDVAGALRITHFGLSAVFQLKESGRTWPWTKRCGSLPHLAPQV